MPVILRIDSVLLLLFCLLLCAESVFVELNAVLVHLILILALTTATNEEINVIIHDMRQTSLELTVEDRMIKFVGVKIEQVGTGAGRRRSDQRKAQSGVDC